MALALSIGATIATTTPANAQGVSASQVTPPTMRPATHTGNAAISLPAMPGLTPPPGVEALLVSVGRVVVEGAFPGMEAASAEIESALRGKRVSVAQIFKLATALERAYGNAGYSLVRVSVPPQQLEDRGAVRFIVVDGYIEDVDVEALPERIRSAVRNRLAPVVRRPRIRQVEIERAVLLAGELPGIRLKSAMARGKEAGGTRLVVEGEHDIVSGGSASDNRLSTSLGGWSLNNNIAISSALSYGEQVYGSFNAIPEIGTTLRENAPMRSFGIGMVMPLGANGWTINPEYTSTTTNPTPSRGAPRTIGLFERLALRTSYPVVKTRAETLSLTGEVSHLKETTAYADFPTDQHRDSFTAARFGADWSRLLDDGAALSGNTTLSQGLGGRGTDDVGSSKVPLSRQGGEPVFTKLTGDLRYSRPLIEQVQLSVTVRSQTSLGQALLQSEQFALDATDAISAYVPGSFSVDEGVTARGELQRSFDTLPIGWKGGLAPYVFGAGGIGRLAEPTAVERASAQVGAVGGGLRGTVVGLTGVSEARFGLELARRFSDSSTVPDGYRFNVSAGMKF